MTCIKLPKRKSQSYFPIADPQNPEPLTYIPGAVRFGEPTFNDAAPTWKAILSLPVTLLREVTVEQACYLCQPPGKASWFASAKDLPVQWEASRKTDIILSPLAIRRGAESVFLGYTVGYVCWAAANLMMEREICDNAHHTITKLSSSNEGVYLQTGAWRQTIGLNPFHRNGTK